ncbi:hypothetical protein JYU34_022551 [Plutella xylostella]|uniref:Uncharacterized protein n=1 Tax=Plutella xylostella TaxID=51655 RepID=A0ABQ7PQ25_PLUXY|nr:hypothetical protein JYU34_022551 [Plutella xylostella]
MSFLDTITFRRRPRTQSETQMTEDEANSTKNALDGTSNSMPSFSEDEDEVVKDLKSQIEHLQIELKAAHDEIGNLSLENAELKNSIKVIEKENDMYKKVTNSLKNDLATPKKKKENISAMLTKTPRIITEKYVDNKIDTTKESTKQKTQVKPNHNNDTSKLHRLTTPKARDSNRNSSTMTNQPRTQNKLLIVSSNKTNNILEITRTTFHSDYNSCHDLTPNVGIKQLLWGIEAKLKNFTKDDFCVILIGESDFKTTNNYFDLVVYIREILQPLHHTNILICLPTFKCHDHTSMFNWRVETFNNLIYLDALTHEHIFVLDSNANLTYDYNMFSRGQGQLNDKGMQTVFYDIYKSINFVIKKYRECPCNHITNKQSVTNSCNTNNSSDFFRV